MMLNTKCYMHNAHIIVVFFKSYEIDPLLREKYLIFAMGLKFQVDATGQLFKRGTSDPKAPREKGIFSSRTGTFHSFFDVRQT